MTGDSVREKKILTQNGRTPAEEIQFYADEAEAYLEDMLRDREAHPLSRVKAVVKHTMGRRQKLVSTYAGPDLNSEGIADLRSYQDVILHEFNSRFNFFLVFQSLLLGGTLALLGEEQRPSACAFLALTLLGISTSLVWLYVLKQTRSLLKQVRGRLKKEKGSKREWLEWSKTLRRRRISSTEVIANFPWAVIVIWLFVAWIADEPVWAIWQCLFRS